MAGELDLEVLELAFLHHLLREVAGADGALGDREAALIEQVCPPDALRRAGLIDAQGEITELGRATSIRALAVLPDALSEPDKLGLVGRLGDLARIDGRVEVGERSLVVLAAQLLRVPVDVVTAHLDA